MTQVDHGLTNVSRFDPVDSVIKNLGRHRLGCGLASGSCVVALGDTVRRREHLHVAVHDDITCALRRRPYAQRRDGVKKRKERVFTNKRQESTK
jgi:hypothetical protein